MSVGSKAFKRIEAGESAQIGCDTIRQDTTVRLIV